MSRARASQRVADLAGGALAGADRAVHVAVPVDRRLGPGPVHAPHGLAQRGAVGGQRARARGCPPGRRARSARPASRSRSSPWAPAPRGRRRWRSSPAPRPAGRTQTACGRRARRRRRRSRRPRRASRRAASRRRWRPPGPLSDSAWPFRPFARQNGLSYTAATFSSVPWGTRAFSAARSAGRSGLKSIWPASTGGMATITRLALTIRREDSTRTPVLPCTIFLTGERSTTRLPSRLCSSWAICCEPPHEALLLRAVARVEVALERAQRALVARGGDVVQDEQQAQLARLAAEDRPAGHGGQAPEPLGGAVGVQPALERLAVPLAGARRAPRRVRRARWPPSRSAPRSPWPGPAGWSGPAARSRWAACR